MQESQFSTTITLGNIIQLVSLIFLSIALYKGISDKISVMKDELSKEIHNLNTRMAAIGTKVDTMWAWWLRYGNGGSHGK